MHRRDAEEAVRLTVGLIAITALSSCLLSAFAQTKGKRPLDIPCAPIEEVEALERESSALTELSPPVRAGSGSFREVYFYRNNRLFFYNSEAIGSSHRRITIYVPALGRELIFEADTALVDLPDHWIGDVSAMSLYFLNTQTNRMNRMVFEVYFGRKPSGNADWLEGKLLEVETLDGVCSR
jgi:hypothetical protein